MQIVLKIKNFIRLFLPLLIIRIIDSIYFRINKFSSSFDKEANKFFIQSLKSCSNYAEYGSGFSTFQAHKLGINYKSIESSKDWIALMQKKNKFLNIKYIDIGETTKWSWGRPINYSKRDNFIKYAESIFESNDPDLILIDARLRVLCFLVCLKKSSIGTKILFDDYLNRGEYHIVEELILPKKIIGRMAYFEINNRLNSDKIDQLIFKFEYVLD